MVQGRRQLSSSAEEIREDFMEKVTSDLALMCKILTSRDGVGGHPGRGSSGISTDRQEHPRLTEEVAVAL